MGPTDESAAVKPATIGVISQGVPISTKSPGRTSFTASLDDPMSPKSDRSASSHWSNKSQRSGLIEALTIPMRVASKVVSGRRAPQVSLEADAKQAPEAELYMQVDFEEVGCCPLSQDDLLKERNFVPTEVPPELHGLPLRVWTDFFNATCRHCHRYRFSSAEVMLAVLFATTIILIPLAMLLAIPRSCGQGSDIKRIVKKFEQPLGEAGYKVKYVTIRAKESNMTCCFWVFELKDQWQC